ncbi:MAG: phosphonomutase [Gammaproteobacteria bacterium]|nr:MAG: phosphonomutase [Gammaproteobacteria bacterium]
MRQAEKAIRFADLHQKGNPVVLYNIWDAAGAKALAEAGAPAVATGSWSVAAAHGYEDGEAIPLDFVLRITERICASVDLPVSVDFEGGYATEPAEVAENVRRIIHAGAVGINLEDGIVRGEGLHSVSSQAARIRAIRSVAAEEGIPLVLNARTDLFLDSDPATHKAHLAEALEREAAYGEAGADCFFVPGLTESSLISRIVDGAKLPVNVLMMGELKAIRDVAALGVSRASYGPGPFRRFLADFRKAYAGSL